MGSLFWGPLGGEERKIFRENGEKPSGTAFRGEAPERRGQKEQVWGGEWELEKKVPLKKKGFVGKGGEGEVFFEVGA